MNLEQLKVPEMIRYLCFVLVVVRYIRSCMKETSNTMPTIGTNDTALIFFGNFVNLGAQVSVKSARLYHVYCCSQTIKGRLY